MQWQSRARAVCGLICASLAACSVGTPYRRPDIPLPQQWNATAANGANPAPDTSAAVWPKSDWWHGFGSDRLDELIAQAQKSNDDLAGAIARVQEADAQLRIAGAPLLPSADLGATATRERGSVSGEGITMFNLSIRYSPRATSWTSGARTGRHAMPHGQPRSPAATTSKPSP